MTKHTAISFLVLLLISFVPFSFVRYLWNSVPPNAGLAIILIPNVSLFKITLIADFMNGLMLPIVFYFLYKLANNGELLGKYVNSRLQNILLVGSAIVISLGVIVGFIGKLLNV